MSGARISSEKISAAAIINADDWGRDADTTGRSLECFLGGTVSSVSAMVFIADSERAAALAREHAVDAGLHVNFTSPFSAPGCPRRLMEHQQKLARFLLSTRLSQVAYHPGLAASFEYVFAAQVEEFERRFGVPPNRFDGHHHMHLCANVLRQELLQAGSIVRRNLSFGPGEKGVANRFYRRWQDRKLARRHRTSGFFFSLLPCDPQRLERIFQLARQFDVEIGTHPVRPEEYRFLMGPELKRYAAGTGVARGYSLHGEQEQCRWRESPAPNEAGCRDSR